jgi:hypothetical protein
MPEEVPPKVSLAEKNRIYQQRHRAKLRRELGIDKYREEVNTYMQKYRQVRNDREGYVKREPVQRVKEEPSVRALVQEQKEIVLKPINENRKKNKKEESKIAKQKLELQSKSGDLSTQTLKDYVSKHSRIYALVRKEQMAGVWKQEIIKVLNGHKYDMALENEVLSHLRKDKLQGTINILRQHFSKSENSFKQMINSITGLLGRLQTFDTEYEYVSDIGKNLQALYLEERNKNETTQEELDKINMIKFDDESIMKNIEKLNNLRDKALYAIYMYIPRRLEVNSVRIRYSERNTNTGNHLILSRKELPERFIFNEYKTAKTYSKSVVEVPEQIRPILHEYINAGDFKEGSYLFHLVSSYDMPLSNFSAEVKKVLTKVYGKEIKNQTLRTAFATYFDKVAETVTEKKAVASALSHDYVTNDQYVKKRVKKEK